MSTPSPLVHVVPSLRSPAPVVRSNKEITEEGPIVEVGAGVRRPLARRPAVMQGPGEVLLPYGPRTPAPRPRTPAPVTRLATDPALALLSPKEREQCDDLMARLEKTLVSDNVEDLIDLIGELASPAMKDGIALITHLNGSARVPVSMLVEWMVRAAGRSSNPPVFIFLLRMAGHFVSEARRNDIELPARPQMYRLVAKMVGQLRGVLQPRPEAADAPSIVPETRSKMSKGLVDLMLRLVPENPESYREVPARHGRRAHPEWLSAAEKALSDYKQHARGWVEALVGCYPLQAAEIEIFAELMTRLSSADRVRLAHRLITRIKELPRSVEMYYVWANVMSRGVVPIETIFDQRLPRYAFSLSRRKAIRAFREGAAKGLWIQLLLRRRELGLRRDQTLPDDDQDLVLLLSRDLCKHAKKATRDFMENSIHCAETNKLLSEQKIALIRKKILRQKSS